MRSRNCRPFATPGVPPVFWSVSLICLVFCLVFIFVPFVFMQCRVSNFTCLSDCPFLIAPLVFSNAYLYKDRALKTRLWIWFPTDVYSIQHYVTCDRSVVYSLYWTLRYITSILNRMLNTNNPNVSSFVMNGIKLKPTDWCKIHFEFFLL
jgi:hypothetical protein